MPQPQSPSGELADQLSSPSKNEAAVSIPLSDLISALTLFDGLEEQEAEVEIVWL